MCGITGFWSFTSKLSDYSFDRIAQEMADQLSSRGPDSSGVWWEKEAHLAFGHRRLAIVDLTETGHQPMISSSGRFVITYNGEVYNAPEIHENLISKGYTFRGTSDTEVILTACEAYGVEEATKQLIGMFAFALWDAQDHKLHLVRDRLGIKPLYWGIHQQTLFFGSQVKSFRPHPLWRPELNRDALPNYFRFNYIPGPASIYKDIQKLPPGCIATIEGQNKVSVKPYWTMNEAIQGGQSHPFQSPSEWVDQLDTLLKDAVKRCMVSDVPIGAFLSGGIDSSTVVALMQSVSSTPVQTFSIGFDEEGYNEATHAAAVARHLGTHHHELYLKSREALDIIPTIPQWCDEPFADPSQIPTFLVSRLAQKHLKVCLSGDGGDEFFAGYNRYFQANQLWKWVSPLPLPLRKLSASGIKLLSPSQWDFLANFIPGKKSHPMVGDRAHKLASLLVCPDRRNLYLNLISLWNNPTDLVPGAKDQLSSLWISDSTSSKNSFIEEMQYLDSVTYLPDDILSKVDYASMAVSLESRVPLLDHRVVELSWKIPLELKLKHPQGKWILRQVLKKYVPESLTERPKMGFGVPIDQWLRGALRPWAEELLSEASLSDSGLNSIPIRHRWAEHVSGTRNWQYSLWSILMFQAWRKSVGTT
ncbi:MAG: asparagine synthase (glutamine-hydrolyzing) [Alphaproteobacteria bacterium]|jgi:asparagine synthase (glutamine-hydrolysing)|nr:asparagine synthase (glutamine-hydrolyzing) [Alphaproteobacteria bacterium]